MPVPVVVANEYEAAVVYWCAPYEERRVAVVASRRHFILPFHDSTFECIAEVAEAILPDAAGPAEALARLPLWS